MKTKSLKERVLNPAKLAPHTVSILGDSYQVARLSAAKVNAVNGDLQGKKDPDELAKTTTQFILDSIIDEDGVSLSKSIALEEFHQVYDHCSIQEAYTKIMQVNFGNVEGIEEAKKD
ncbi:hypothetical protein [Neptunomonas japonica]|uniref:hypothetical protein n=1 Tax=Neptunomonas japonica TaxID=417574 RepID=UPI0004282855|nr:hypothetical protein [Neptunomonas japonica]